MDDFGLGGDLDFGSFLMPQSSPATAVASNQHRFASASVHGHAGGSGAMDDTGVSPLMSMYAGSPGATNPYASSSGSRQGAYGGMGNMSSVNMQPGMGGEELDLGLRDEGDGEDDEDDDDGSDGSGDEDGGAGSGGGGKKSGSGGRTLTQEERRLRRLERNRESARQSRRRKKQYLELLEDRVAALQRQMFELRTTHAAAAHAALLEQRDRLLTTVEPLACKEQLLPHEEAALQDAAQQLVDRFGPDAAERRVVRDFHFDQLHRLLLPPHTKFLLWLVHQPPDFFGTPADPARPGAPVVPPNTLWTLLCQEMGLSPEQAERLKGQLRKVLGGPDLPRETWRLGVAATYLQRLRAAVAASAAKAQAQLVAIKGILTAAQFIRYAAWTHRNRDAIAAAVVPQAAVSSSGGAATAAARAAGPDAMAT